MSQQPPDIEELVEQIVRARKYRNVGVSRDTVRDILLTELARQPNRKAALHSTRKKLHEVMALYLGDPDYNDALARLQMAADEGDAALLAACREIMQSHDSTRERLPLLDTFYPRIFAVTGTPQTLLDVACALNPLAIPWMGLPEGATFYAYDIHRQRIAFLDAFLKLIGVAGRAIEQDILVHPPRETGDVALLLKEIHRMEKRRKGIVLPLLDALAVRWIVLSSPTRSRTGRREVKDSYREQVHRILAPRPWRVTEIEFDGELVYCVDKHHDRPAT